MSADSDVRIGSRVKIIGNENPYLNEVILADTDTRLDYVRDATVYLSREETTVVLTIYRPISEITATVSAITRVCPCCGHETEDES